MRTIPPYVFALILMSLTAGHVSGTDFGRYFLYIENFYAQHNAADYFPVAWSLSIEEWFYVAFPALLLTAAAIFRNHRTVFSVLVAIAFIVIITALRVCFGNLNDWGADVRRVVVFRVDAIAYGYLLFIWTASWNTERENPLGLALTLGLFAISTLFAIGLTWQIYLNQSHAAETLFPFAAAAFGMCSILLFHAARPLFERASFAALALFLGQASYSLYLFHLLVANAVVPHIRSLSLPLQLMLYLCACLAFSAVFYRIFEKPILALRPSYDRPIADLSRTDAIPHFEAAGNFAPQRSAM